MFVLCACYVRVTFVLRSTIARILSNDALNVNNVLSLINVLSIRTSKDANKLIKHTLPFLTVLNVSTLINVGIFDLKFDRALKGSMGLIYSGAAIYER